MKHARALLMMLLFPAAAFASPPTPCESPKLPSTVENQREYTQMMGRFFNYQMCVFNRGAEYKKSMEGELEVLKMRVNIVGKNYFDKRTELSAWQSKLCSAPANRQLSNVRALTLWIEDLQHYDGCLTSEQGRVQLSSMEHKQERMAWLRARSTQVQSAIGRAKKEMGAHASAATFVYPDGLPPPPTFP